MLLCFSVSSVVQLLWWFMKGGPSASATEPDLLLSTLPPPPPDPIAWLYYRAAKIIRFFVSWVSRLNPLVCPFDTCLQWRFTQRGFPAPAAEPRIPPSVRPPPAWGARHHWLVLLAFLPTVTASDVSQLLPSLHCVLWSLARHLVQGAVSAWLVLSPYLQWLLPWTCVTLVLACLPLMAITLMNRFLYPLLSSIARVPAKWYFSLFFPTLIGVCILEWIQLLVQNQPTPSFLGKWICSPLYYLFFRGLYDASSNLVDRLLAELLPFDNYSDLRLSLVPSLEDGIWIQPAVRRPNRQAHAWRLQHGRKPLPPKYTIVQCVYIPSFGSIIRSIVKIAVYGLGIYLAHRYRGSPSSPAVSTGPTYEYPFGLNFPAKKRKKYRRLIKPPPPSPPSPPPEWPPPSPNDLLQDVTTHRSFCPTPGFDLDSHLELSDPDPVSVLLSDVSDEHMMNSLAFASKFCSLDDAGVTFSVTHTPLSQSSYRHRRTANFRHFQHQRKSKVTSKPSASSQPIPSAPTYDNILAFYLSQFNPAVVSRIMQDHFVYGYHEAKVSVNLQQNFNGRHPFVNALWMLNLRMEHIPLIVDTGASCCITPCKADFKPGSYSSTDIKVRDLSGENTVIGQGIVLWTVKDTHGHKHVIELPCLHIPSAKVRLLSPQVLKKLHNVGGLIESDGIVLTGANDVKIFAPYSDISNLPELTLHDPPTTSGFWESSFAVDNEQLQAIKDPAARTFESAYLNVLDDGNENLKASQKGLLLWHQKLSHTNFAKVRLLTKNTQWVRVSASPEDALHVDAILPMSHPSPSTVETLECKCAACLLAKARRRTPAKPSKPTVHPPESVL